MGAVAPRTFWWLRQFSLDPFEDARSSAAATASEASDPWPRLLYHLVRGELRDAARLLASLEPMAPGSQAAAGAARLSRVLEGRLSMPPFQEDTLLAMAALNIGARFSQWRRTVIEALLLNLYFFTLVHVLVCRICKSI